MCVLSLLRRLLNCANKNLNLRIKTVAAISRAHTTVLFEFVSMHTLIGPETRHKPLHLLQPPETRHKPLRLLQPPETRHMYTVASAPTVAGPVLMPIFRLFLGQCTLYSVQHTHECIRESLLGKSSVIEVSKTIQTLTSCYIGYNYPND